MLLIATPQYSSSEGLMTINPNFCFDLLSHHCFYLLFIAFIQFCLTCVLQRKVTPRDDVSALPESMFRNKLSHVIVEVESEAMH